MHVQYINKLKFLIVLKTTIQNYKVKSLIESILNDIFVRFLYFFVYFNIFLTNIILLKLG